jgi:hypothetical protein
MQRSSNAEKDEWEIGLTPPSSPELSDSDRDLDSDDETDEFSLDDAETISTTDIFSTADTFSTSGTSVTSQATVEPPSPAVQARKPLSPLEGLLYAYSTAKDGSQPKFLELTARQKVIDYIHTNAVNPPDVKLLIPAYNGDCGFINKLVAAIGYHAAADRIPEAEKEAILTHIFTHANEDVYARVHARIELCQGNMKRRVNRVERRAALQMQCEQQAQAQRLAHRIQEFPPHLRVRVTNPELLPAGATSVAQMYVEVMGLTWDEVRQLGQRQTEVVVDVLEPSFATTRPVFDASCLDVGAQPRVKIPSKGARDGECALEPVECFTTKRWKYSDRLGKRATVPDGDLFARDECAPIRARPPPAELTSWVEMPRPAFVLRADYRGRLNFLASDV